MTTKRSAGSSIAKDPLAVLEVIDRLEVGPVRLEPRRLIATYKVVRGKRAETFELIYRYEEKVFTPGDPGSENLAAMIAAQVALNYGLFCRELCLHGPFDSADRRFLKEMLKNTAREIYVLKLLQPNPFLQGAVAELPTVKRPSYVRAQLVFDGPPTPKSKESGWRGDQRRHAVLSSGGKDSLLTYGLLQELGVDVHPLFVNESGRHWFTALNAFRSFEDDVPNTARVWTNCDRLFNWMLRRLPFVRKDYASKRADMYPVRLWTVAVFLFGVLPLVRKRGIGRLLIGDEHDSTQQGSFRGISHYNGYFDQSRYFDQALTRYFQSKGFKLSQFSVLRPLSELLIEKTLAERYPQLVRDQVSCHATHNHDGRVYPCGACEKCRRIVGMLKAIDVDPGQCGYTPEQTERCLQALASDGVHQEKPGAQQLALMLQEKGLLEGGRLGTVKARPRPELLKLRFDPERAPLDGIPNDLRAPLYRLLLEHADGAVLRKGRMWIDIDARSAQVLGPPYPFEPNAAGSAGVADAAAGPRDYLLAELTWPRAKQRLAETDLALLPVGAVEQHGPHLPLDTDAFDADWLARAAAAACTAPRPLVLPVIPFGVSYHHDDFPGTISVTPDNLSRMVYDVGMSLARHGVTKLLIINGHGGNTPALKFAAQRINCDAHIFTAVDTGESSDADIAEVVATRSDVHAGEEETSTTMAIRPELVQLDAASAFVPEFSSRYLDFSSRRSVEWYARTEKISPTGVLGDPTQASAEKGVRIWEIMIRNLVAFIEQLKGMSLDEIHQRRY